MKKTIGLFIGLTILIICANIYSHNMDRRAEQVASEWNYKLYSNDPQRNCDNDPALMGCGNPDYK